MSMTTPTGGANYNQQAGAGLITSVTPAPASQARVPFAAGIARLPETKRTNESALAQAYRTMSPAMRQALAQQLKDAGYRNPVTSKFNINVRNAFLQANRDLSDEITSRLQMDPAYFDNNKYDLSTFLREQTNAGGGSGGPKTSKSIQSRISTDLDAKALIDAVIRDQLGRAATAEEVTKYTKAIQKRQAKSPVTTSYETAGGVTTSKTTGGFNEQQYLIDKIAGTDEAKANRVLGFYETFMNALGRD